MNDMEKLMRNKCREYKVPFEVLTDGEKECLRQEVEAECQGYGVLDTVLRDRKVFVRALRWKQGHGEG